MLFPNGHFVFLDLETTGGKASMDRITEVGLIEVLDGEIIDQYQTLLNPEQPISSFITSLTGINDAMVVDAPVFAGIAEDLLSRLLGKTLVAHNARFDHSFLKNEFKRAGLDYRTKVLCTVKLSRSLMPELRSHSLDNLIHFHGLHVDGRHRAMADTDLMIQLVAKLSRRLGVDTVEAAIAQQIKVASMPSELDPVQVTQLPNTPGVYFFYDEKDTLLYVGKSVAIRDRVKSHFSNDHASDKELELSRQVRRIDHKTTAGDFGAQLLEAHLIKKLQPVYNRQMRRNKYLWFWERTIDKKGYQQLKVRSATDLPLDNLDNIIGLFRSKKMAEQALLQLAAEKQLCHRLTGLEKTRSGACFAHQLKKCLGACAEKESPRDYNERIEDALAPWKFKVWPYAGPVVVAEEGVEKTDYHFISHWCYLGTQPSPEFSSEKPETTFEYDIYKILLKFLSKKNLSVSVVGEEATEVTE